MDINFYREHIKPKKQLAKKIDFIRTAIKDRREKLEDRNEESASFLKPVVKALQGLPNIREQIVKPFSEDDVAKLQTVHGLPNPYTVTNTLPVSKRVGRIIKDLGRRKGRTSNDQKIREFDSEMNFLRRYNDFIITGSGITPIFYNKIDDLKDRLNLVLGSIKAGNESLDLKKEANSILHEMYKKDAISNEKLKNFLIHYNIE